MTSVEILGQGLTSLRSRERLVAKLREEGISDQRVLDAIRDVPRHLFVEEAFASRAYENTALPIGFNQTISQPYIVARMTQELLAGGPLNKVLEVGTGSAYQAAILGKVANRVYSIERIKKLYLLAQSRLQKLKIRNVYLRYSDGALGWPDAGPFDGIMVTAAPAEIPLELQDQLAVGGRMVIPVGEQAQELRVITRTPTGFSAKVIEAVRFVPLLRGQVS
ncbi:MAG TPA: protein-L-isoaspartate(D-aspartate) O-methyltransferase [Pseudomonadales bacterium]|nr:protein-L-isoaspartate(D-aspartate) O-methyltransferase [Pseudomonadales bacterium]